jgi:mannose-6-phosphate isomerase-like protein (cupin superfamily)
MKSQRPCEVVDFAALEAVACPCGTARRAFEGLAELPLTVHRTSISVEAARHYHRRLTEVYYVLDCDEGAAMELDGVLHPVRPGVAVAIPPGVRHRGMGKMEVLIVVSPKFDASDEWFD